MDNTLKTLGDDIAAMINDLEARLDGAVRLTSRLSVAVGDYGDQAGVSLRGGQATLEQLGRLLATITTARGEAITAHRHIERIAKVTGYGDGVPKPEWTEPRGTAHLQVVAEAA
jgi:hypothetical protein